MISVVVPYWESNPDKASVLKRTLTTFKDYDELILVWNQGIGMTRSVNKGFELARGDFIVMASDDGEILEGSLKDLAVPGVVTSPCVNGKDQAFSGVMFCVPRDIYEKYGMWDMAYADGIYYEDEDYWMMLKSNNIPHMMVNKVQVRHEHGGQTIQCTPEKQAKQQRNYDIFVNKWKDKRWL